MFYLLNYTRKPVSSILYDARLAYSMHLAISDDGEKFQYGSTSWRNEENQ